MKIIFVFVLLALLGGAYVFFGFSTPVVDSPANVKSEIENSDSKIAIRGFDAVAYFTDSKAMEGKEEISHTWNDKVWYFSSEENKKKFMDAPEKYEPQYHGYCAWAVGNNYTAPSDPNAWKIHNNKLYLNYDLDVQKKWEANMEKYIADGDKNWQELKK